MRREIIIACALLTNASLAAAQIVVTEESLGGWVLAPFGVPPAEDFVEGPATPPAGTGSFSSQIQVPASKSILFAPDLVTGDLFSRLTTLSYSTWVDSSGTNTNNWYVNLYVDANGDATYDTRLDYVPPPGDVVVDTWQTWDAHSGTWSVSTGGTTTLSDFSTNNPNARFSYFGAAGVPAIVFNMGDTAANYVGFIGNLDAVTIGDGPTLTDYDFEAALPSVLTVPTVNGLGQVTLLAALGALSLWFLQRRR